jgi:hypothetical protein
MHRYSLRKKTGAKDANAAPACSAKTPNVWRGARGSQRQYRHLSSHEQLPDVRRGALIGLTGYAEYGNVKKHNH